MVYNKPDQLQKTVYGRMMADSSISPVNKKAIAAHVSFLFARGANIRTVIKHQYCLIKFFGVLGKNVDVRKATKLDLERAMGGIERSEMAPETKRNIKSITKAFYKHLLGDDLFYPPQVAWIKTSQKRSRRMLPEDLLSEDDIFKLLETASNARDKAIIALLFDSGIRVGELLSLRKKDIDLVSEPAHVTVNGKTGMRKIPIMFSVQYLVQYLNTAKGLKPEQPLWKNMGVYTTRDSAIEYSTIWKMLHEVAVKAKISKRVNPHSFRHSRATYYANKLTEQQLKVFFGWTGGSNMAATYVHLSGRDIDNAVMEANGEKPVEEKAVQPKLKERKCLRCQFSNPADSTYCARCGGALDIDTAMKGEGATKKLKEAMIEALEDPEVMERLMGEYLVKQKKGKKGD